MSQLSIVPTLNLKQKGVQIKEGKDLTIIANGYMVDPALKATQALEQEGISARVIDIHTIKPIDTEIVIKAARNRCNFDL